MQHEHDNLHRSMAHFLALDTAARALVVAGFHTGHGIVAAFFDEEELERVGLEVDYIAEVDVYGRCRKLRGVTGVPVEDIGEKRKWLVVATLKWGKEFC